MWVRAYIQFNDDATEKIHQLGTAGSGGCGLGMVQNGVTKNAVVVPGRDTGAGAATNALSLFLVGTCNLVDSFRGVTGGVNENELPLSSPADAA